MKYLHLVIWLFLVSSCTMVEKHPCDQACEFQQQVKLLNVEKRMQRKEIAGLTVTIKRYEANREKICEKCWCHEPEVALYSCTPTKESDGWNVAFRGGMPGDFIQPYLCAFMVGHPVNKYPHAFRKLWHAKANECIFRVQNILDDPNGELGYRANGLNVTIKWKSPPNKRKWVPKKLLKDTL